MISGIHSKRPPKRAYTLALLLLIDFVIIASAQSTLAGVDLFENSNFAGIPNGISFAGGTEIMVKGNQQFSLQPSNLVVSVNDGTNQIDCPLLTTDNIFKSNTQQGLLQYTMPSLLTLYNQASYTPFDSFITIPMQLKVIDIAAPSSPLVCSQSTKCALTYSRAYTPVLYYIVPQVIYFNSDISYFLDPKSSMNYKKSTDLPYKTLTIDGINTNTEQFIGISTVFGSYYTNSIRGKVGEVSPNPSSSIVFKLASGNAMIDQTSANTCDINNLNCYVAKSLAAVTSVSANAGFTTGGQLLTLQGQGFLTGTTVTIDGVACTIKTLAFTSLTCESGANSASVTPTLQPGQGGLRRKMYNSTNAYQTTITNITSATPTSMKLATSLETPIDESYGQQFGNIFQGYFKAPLTTNYRFYVSEDDYVRLLLSTDMSPANLALKIQINGANGYRNYINLASYQTAWIPLVAGQYYYMQVEHIQINHGSYVSVAVEIEQTAIPNHQNSNRELQQLLLGPPSDSTYESWILTVRYPDSGNYTIQIGTYLGNITVAILNKATANTFYNALWNYYWGYYRTYYTVVRYMYDNNTATTTDENVATTIVYVVTLNRLITGQSFNTLIITGNGTSSLYTWERTSTSSSPLTGSFKIGCTLPTAVVNYTAPINIGDSPTIISTQIQNTCPQYRDKIQVQEGSTYPYYYTSGRDIKIRFSGYGEDPTQMTLIPDLITGGGVSASYIVQNLSPQPKNPNIFYEPIPFELLHTPETTPVIKVTSGGLPAAFQNLNNQYVYSASTSSITGYTLTAGNTITITGTTLPITTLVDIKFSNANCTVTSKIATQTVCTVLAVAGSWKPFLRDQQGYIPDAYATNIVVPITATSVSPSSINPNGNLITIGGAGFPNSLTDGNTISITFTNSLVSGTMCSIFSINNTMIICTTPKISPSATSTMTIAINDQTNSALTLTTTISPGAVVSVTPASASPVLKTDITILVNGALTQSTMLASDISVKFISLTNPDYVKDCNVISIDNTAKTIKIRFGGADSGNYFVSVISAALGQLESLTPFQVKGTVLDFNPKQCSVKGGALITITGQNFGTDANDNPVRIGYTDCIIVSSTTSSITCRVSAKVGAQTASQEQMLVFLKTSEEAQCLEAGSCMFSWIDNYNPVLDGATYAFDSVSGGFIATLTGSGFQGTISDAHFYIDGFEQLGLTLSPTVATFQITNTLDLASTNVALYFTYGIATISAGFPYYSVAPIPISIGPAIGSSGGSLLTYLIAGVGISTKGLTIKQTTSKQIVCTNATVVAYRTAYCITAQGGIVDQLEVVRNTVTYTCVDAVTNCTYSTVQSTLPTLSGAVVSGSTIVLTGTNLNIAGYTVSGQYFLNNATSVTINSATSATIRFAYGVPITNQQVAPLLLFTGTTQPLRMHYPSYPSGQPTMSNSLGATPAVRYQVLCSFAGGCLMEVVANGLSTMLSNSADNYITVCGQKCIYSQANSNSTLSSCIIPYLATIYSVSNYYILTPSFVYGSIFSSNSSMTDVMFSGSNFTNFIDTTTAACYIGTSFQFGYFGVISEFSFYMNKMVPSFFAGRLRFQGSNDGFFYTTLINIGYEIHEGWNYYDLVKLTGKQQKYRIYRLLGNAVGRCAVAKIHLKGVQVINDDSNGYSCSPTLTLSGSSSTLGGNFVTYIDQFTPLLRTVNPRFGDVFGGQAVVFTGDNFPNDITAYTILIDDIPCVVTSTTDGSVTCTTGPRTGLVTSSLKVFIKDQGYASTQGILFRYCNSWSSKSTWGGEPAPIQGDSVYIPVGMNLLMDIDSTPILNSVIIEGSLIFPPNGLDSTHVRSFDAYYIYINGGYFEAGTEEAPYSSKLIITLHGNKYSPSLPIYGNKVFAVRNGQLDLHGVTRSPTWTTLFISAVIGDTTITLSQAVDWVAGDEIIIAPTGYDKMETEKKIIVNVDNSDPTHSLITLNSALSFDHQSYRETYGTNFIDMKAEVALLTRNIVIRGDPQTSGNNKYGAQMFLYSPGDESLVARIGYVQFTDVGQASFLGRYPINFYMIGTLRNSYVIGTSICKSYNRALSFHGVYYLTVQWNVAYNIIGHAFIIEDAVETNNVLEDNLVIQVFKTSAMLNTDLTPAAFWITNPNNMLRRNRAVGSDSHGFWYNLPVNPTGSSYTSTICPNNEKLGEFNDNVAHSNGQSGFIIFNSFSPRSIPCQALYYDAAAALNGLDPYQSNALVTANFNNTVSWRNKENGAILEQVGDVRLNNFKCAENLVAQIEVSSTGTADNTAQIYNALVIGCSAHALTECTTKFFYGIIPPRTDNFLINIAKFYRFQNAGQAALGSCSHCKLYASADPNARIITALGLTFDATTVPRRISYQYPYNAIFYSNDTTLTGVAGRWWATYGYPYLLQAECANSTVALNYSVICSSTVQMRRIAFTSISPDLRPYQMKIMKYDTWPSAAVKADPTQYSAVNYTNNVGFNGWAYAFVTNHKYKLHWNFGMDFTRMQIYLNTKWKTTDLNTFLVLNRTAVRTQFIVSTGGSTVENNTLLFNNPLQTGDWVDYNDTAIQELHMAINGKNTTRTYVQIDAYKCWPSCFPITIKVNLETRVRYWSTPGDWENNGLQVPTVGQDAEIAPGWNMYFDAGSTAVLNSLTIKGRLTFLGNAITVQEIKSKFIYVNGGELIIGTSVLPFPGQVTITLVGNKYDTYNIVSNDVDSGNKLLANNNVISIYGKARSKMSRLLANAQGGDSQITVETGLDWVAGDNLGIAANTMNWQNADYAVVLSYTTGTGVVVLDRPISYYHFGAATSTASSYSGVDMRAEVVLLTRNVKIVGENTDSWGCQVITFDAVEDDGFKRNGTTILDNVEIYNCSQKGTFKAALRWDGARRSQSTVSNSVLHHGLGRAIAIQGGSWNVSLINNVIFDFYQFGINFEEGTANHIVTNNQVHHIQGNQVGAGISVCGRSTMSKCKNITVQNNVVSGAFFAGFIAYGRSCGGTATNFDSNVAHSIKGAGAFIYPDFSDQQQQVCTEASTFSAYKCSQYGAAAMFNTSQTVWKNFVLIDNGYGTSLNIGQENLTLSATIQDSFFYGDTVEIRDCDSQNQCINDIITPNCVKRVATMLPQFTSKAKSILSNKYQPMHRIIGDASWAGVAVYQNNQFINYASSTTYCGNKQYIIELNEYASDYQPYVYFLGTTFTNVLFDAIVRLYDPPTSWANIAQCGDFPCTGPNNILLKFSGTTTDPILKIDLPKPVFQIISKSAVATANYPNCNLNSVWNAKLCYNRLEGLGVILFESLENDASGRALVPIQVADNAGVNNTLNSFMIHDLIQDFYRMSNRMPRFPALIQTSPTINQIYNISYIGTPASDSRFALRSDGYEGALISIMYLQPIIQGVYSGDPKNGGLLIQSNAWNESLKSQGALKGNTLCGENRFLGVFNILEFYMRAGCEVYISPLDQVICSVRMNWTLSSFYQSGGSTKFVDRLAAVLGIKANTIKIVAVYSGSTVIHFNIVKDIGETPGNSVPTLISIKDALIKLIKNASSVFGAPILEGTVKLGSEMANNAGNKTGMSDNAATATAQGPLVVTNTNSKTNTTVVSQVGVISTDEQTKTQMTIIIVAVFSTIIAGGVIALIVFLRCRRIAAAQTANNVVKTIPMDSNPSSPDLHIDEIIMEQQFHPKAEIGKFSKQNESDRVGTYDDSMRDTQMSYRSNMALTNDGEEWDMPPKLNLDQSRRKTIPKKKFDLSAIKEQISLDYN